MLLTRCTLFLIFATSLRGNGLPAKMFTTTLVLVAILSLKFACALKVYKDFRVSVLEFCFLLNLLILSAILYYLRDDGSNTISRCISASVSVSMVLFIGILAYHVYLRVNRMRWFASIESVILTKWPRKKHDTVHAEDTALPNLQHSQPTTTSVELREALLASDSIAI